MSVTVTIPAWVDGVLTPVEKLEAHLKGLRHKAVSVFVIAGGEVLIQRRALGKYHTPGLWANTCCTHPEWGETAAACAVRRLREELGITAVVPEARVAAMPPIEAFAPGSTGKNSPVARSSSFKASRVTPG